MEYDIAEAFRKIELELISSMKRNWERHNKEQDKYGFTWTRWQAEQLKGFRDFRKNNPALFKDKFNAINNRFLDSLLKQSNDNFFGINDTKIKALAYAAKNDLVKAEHAMLRKANDEFRKVIFNAQTYMASGAGTIKKAIDMASNDFLNKGINCVVYKGGRHVNIANYAEMSLRTTNKRVTLFAEGGKRQLLGIHTVKVSSYGMCSKTCLPWQGRVYIDDVYSGGTKEEAEELKLPLLSTAIKGGLFHPNCKHTTKTYYPDLDNDDEDNPRVIKYENPPGTQEHHYLQYLLQKERRLQAGSLSEDKILKHAAKEQEILALDKKWQEVVDGYRKYEDTSKINKSIDKAINLLKTNPLITRHELTKLFPEKTYIGKNPITQKPVYVLAKDMSYFIDKHFRDGSLNIENLKNISDVLDYDCVAKELDKYGNEIGQMFIKKAIDRKGYFDGIVKTNVDGDEIFHYQYRNIHSFNRLINKKIKHGLIIDDKRIDINNKKWLNISVKDN